MHQMMLPIAFTAPLAPYARHNSYLFMSDDAEPSAAADSPIIDGIEPDSHQELMYTLGVNLARQLGDIRPLIENSEELTSVAKGILDTVVGRLDDDGQKMMLSKVC